MLSVDVSLRPIIFLHYIRHRATGQLPPCLLSMIVCSQGCMCAFAIDQAWRIDVMWLVRLESLILTLDPQGESSSERNSVCFDHRTVRWGCRDKAPCDEENMIAPKRRMGSCDTSFAKYIIHTAERECALSVGQLWNLGLELKNCSFVFCFFLLWKARKIN